MPGPKAHALGSYLLVAMLPFIGGLSCTRTTHESPKIIASAAQDTHPEDESPLTLPSLVSLVADLKDDCDKIDGKPCLPQDKQASLLLDRLGQGGYWQDRWADDDDLKTESAEAFEPHYHLVLGPLARRLATQNESRDRQRDAAFALADLGHPLSLPLLLAAAQEASSDELKHDYMQAMLLLMGAKGSHSPEFNLLDRQDRDLEPFLLQSCKDTNPRIREVAVRALARLNNAANGDLLATMGAEDRDLMVRTAAIRALGGQGTPDHIPVLSQALAHSFPPIAIAAAEALVAMGGDGAKQAIVQHLANRKTEVRPSVVNAAGRLGAGDAVDLLCELATAESVHVRLEAIKALGSLGDRAATPVLVKALDSPMVRERQMALGAIAELGAVEALASVVRLARSERIPSVRQRAAEVWVTLLESEGGRHAQRP